MFQCDAFVTMEEKVNSEFHIHTQSELQRVRRKGTVLKGDKRATSNLQTLPFIPGILAWVLLLFQWYLLPTCLLHE